MGEVADMMLGGELCVGCGEYIDDDADGIPRYCSKQCQHEHEGVPVVAKPKGGPTPPKMNCPVCQRRIKKAGLSDHVRALHGDVA
ncbi:MAG: hypothetical protein JWP38_3697 [Herbaspirillum sp.]|nr:hypothetical protein [Herbaspirillum sp.]